MLSVGVSPVRQHNRPENTIRFNIQLANSWMTTHHAIGKIILNGFHHRHEFRMSRRPTHTAGNSPKFKAGYGLRPFAQRMDWISLADRYPNSVKSITLLLSAILVFPPCVLVAQEPTLAFPGAEGYGRFAKGGRGGDVYHVTNLNDSGKGSLRDSIQSKKAKVPRTVVFDVGGTIKLKKELRVEGVHGLTLAGQTAPGAGITLRDHGIEFRKCSDIILRYMRFRLGDETKTSEDVIGFGPEEGTCRDVILDHITATWGIDGIMDVYGADRFTMQWCLFGEAHQRQHPLQEGTTRNVDVIPKDQGEHQHSSQPFIQQS